MGLLPPKKQLQPEKPTIIGLYGISGSGKSFLLKQLKQELDPETFTFYEGSDVIASLVPGGLSEFHNLKHEAKEYWREKAIETIKDECAESGKVGVVTGHFMFWKEGEEGGGKSVCTASDLEVYTHILYLDVPAEVIAQRCRDDEGRVRLEASVVHLSRWQDVEMGELRRLCHQHGILFMRLSSRPMLSERVELLRSFGRLGEKLDLEEAEKRLDGIVAESGYPQTMLVMDADRTLAPEDTGKIFWDKFLKAQKSDERESPLKELFGGPLGYSYTTFLQTTLLYEEAADDDEFDALCEEVAGEVHMYPEFISLLHLAGEQKHVGAVVVTCGLRRVWEKVLEREGLSGTVKIIGGGRTSDGIVVTAAIKAALVSRLRGTHRMRVCAFGDSPLDLGMLSQADQAIVVVGEEKTRSKTMDADLEAAINKCGLQAYQTLLPETTSPRLNGQKLPLVKLTDHDFVDSILRPRIRHGTIQVLHATERGANKLLQTPTRDSEISGPVLQKAHRSVGRYLAREFLTELLGTETYPVQGVQGTDISGYRLLHEQRTLIVAIMRGGGPLATGVNDAIPLAELIHAENPGQVEGCRLKGKTTVLLVDSVVNSGKTIIDFVEYIRKHDATIRIVVVASVVQAECVSDNRLARVLPEYAKLSIVALRISDNKFTGSGGTDTGNRLFNTTHLP
ncbi:hypothetical protein FQN54_006644 [Arachnomyces sp. PD_36]|nr:hypothetical protein FQN54_006644 [Arachnomyces sp. PD_36]